MALPSLTVGRGSWRQAQFYVENKAGVQGL